MPEVKKRVLALDHDGCLGEIVDLIFYGKNTGLSNEDRKLLLDPTVRSKQTGQDKIKRLDILAKGLTWAMNLLEDKVKIATKEIEDEKGKVSNLLNNMRQAVFLIDGNWIVIPPVSEFTNHVS